MVTSKGDGCTMLVTAVLVFWSDSNSTSGWKSWLRDRWHGGDLAPVASLLALLAIFTALVGPRDFLNRGTASLVLEPRSVTRLDHVLKLNTGFGGANGAVILHHG